MFDLEADYPLLCSWWEAAGQTPVECCMFTDLGVVAMGDFGPVAAAWFAVNNRSRVARAEYTISNPQLTADEQREGVDLIYGYFADQAREIGKHFDTERPHFGSELKLLPPGPQVGHEVLDACEAEILQKATGEHAMITTHRFAPGIYIRQLFIPFGTLLTGRIHLTEHPYVISQGDISVWTKETGTLRLKAPYTGFTLPGTRRLGYAHEDTIWTSFHATTETDVDKIEAAILDPRSNPLITPALKNSLSIKEAA